MDMKDVVKRNIVLIGSMGSGKSHFGRNLSEKLHWQFVDTDRVLEVRYGLPIADIYRKLGEKGFRKAESDILKQVSIYHEAVISVGGNFPIEMKTLRFLKKYSYIIGIRAAQYRIVSRVNRRIGKRPTMNYDDVSGYVTAMLHWWKPVYKKCDFVLDTTNGRTKELISIIEGQFQKNNIYFKKRHNNSKKLVKNIIQSANRDKSQTREKKQTCHSYKVDHYQQKTREKYLRGKEN